MASLGLSIVGQALGGPIGGAIGGAIGGLIDNVLFPASSTPPPTITSSSYGQALPLVYGPQTRLGCNMIWTSGWFKQTGKTAKMAQIKGLPPAYECDCAFAVAAGPIDPSWVIKIWANGSILFDSTLAGTPPVPDENGVVTWSTYSGTTYKDFSNLTVYPGNFDQLPDPVIESYLGVGNVPAYRGTAYFVLTGLLGTAFGNSVPVLNVLCQAQAKITLGQICTDIASRSGIDTTTISTSALTGECMGYKIEAQTDGVTALQPLCLCYDFDVAEVGGGLRFVPRGQEPVCTIVNTQLAGHENGAQRPSFKWPREPEMTLPKVAAITFVDPDRDCQGNTQSERAATGSMQSLLQTSVKVTMTSDQARAVAARMLWEAQYGRQTLEASADDRIGFLESAKTYAIQVPNGFETIRITRRLRGANNVIEFEAKRDAPSLYSSTAPGASAQSQDNALGLGGPVNPPVFIEPPATFPGLNGAATILIALSGGEDGEVNPAWGGCNVYVSTDDSTGDYVLAGVQLGVSCMGVTTSELFSFSGGNPDDTHFFDVDTSESGGEPGPMSNLDAQDAQTVYWVGGEFLSAADVTAEGDNVYQLAHLYRALYGTTSPSHSAGVPFVRCDSQCFRYPLPEVYVGRELFFRFVSAGENLASATTYTFTPAGVVASSAGSVQDVVASEAIAAGSMVNLWSNAGVLNMRNADSTDTTKPANGFVNAAVAMGASAPFFQTGATDAALAGLTPGATYWLGTGGGVVGVAPATTGEGVQIVGVALSASELLFQPGAIVAVP